MIGYDAIPSCLSRCSSRLGPVFNNCRPLVVIYLSSQLAQNAGTGTPAHPFLLAKEGHSAYTRGRITAHSIRETLNMWLLIPGVERRELVRPLLSRPAETHFLSVLFPP